MTGDLKDFFKSENLWRHKKAESEALNDGALIFLAFGSLNKPAQLCNYNHQKHLFELLV